MILNANDAVSECHFLHSLFPVVPSIPTEAPTISLDDNTTNSSTPTTPVFTPDITACESPYIYKIYRNLFHDSLALHNLDTSLVEVYNWTTMVSPEGPVLDKELTKLNATEFISESDGSFVFVGWTIDSKYDLVYSVNVSF